MSYERFAFLYDELMSDVPYEKWVEFVERYMEHKGSILDLACGTGNITLPLAKKGYNVVGVDLSEDMLAVAQQKLAEVGLFVPFYQQDMRELDLSQTFDCITIFCDSLNYLLEESSIQETFQKVWEHLRDDGLFLFDVHSLYKMHHLFQNQTYTVNEEDVALIWNCFEGEHPDSVEHEMTFFVRDEDIYRRFDEFHTQRTYPVESLLAWLEKAGFSVISVTGDFTEAKVTSETERIFIAAQKKPL
ncbi:class I SAM-dependent DNA methyltransferase [Microbacteriaceae bacterium 4G12]